MSVRSKRLWPSAPFMTAQLRILIAHAGETSRVPSRYADPVPGLHGCRGFWRGGGSGLIRGLHGSSGIASHPGGE
eukprot:1212211-Rhodomonas_salina.1